MSSKVCLWSNDDDVLMVKRQRDNSECRFKSKYMMLHCEVMRNKKNLTVLTRWNCLELMENRGKLWITKFFKRLIG